MKLIVCFEGTNNIGPWRLFTAHRPQFGHVFIIYYDVDNNIWIKFECASQRFVIDTYKGEDADWLVGYLIENCICLDCETEHTVIYAPRFTYCVSIAKHFVGIRSPWILTPYQLYCELIKKGAKRIFEQK